MQHLFPYSYWRSQINVRQFFWLGTDWKPVPYSLWTTEGLFKQKVCKRWLREAGLLSEDFSCFHRNSFLGSWWIDVSWKALLSYPEPPHWKNIHKSTKPGALGEPLWQPQLSNTGTSGHNSFLPCTNSGASQRWSHWATASYPPWTVMLSTSRQQWCHLSYPRMKGKSTIHLALYKGKK